VRSSPLLLSLIALPPTTAVPTTFPMDPITRVPFAGHSQLASGGRYYVSSRTPNRSIVLKKNKYYKGPIPGHITQWEYKAQIQADQAFLLINSGQSDWAADGLDSAVYAGLGQKYGTKTGRFRVIPSSCVFYVALNTARPVFANTSARKAINYAIDRTQLIRVHGVPLGSLTLGTDNGSAFHQPRLPRPARRARDHPPPRGYRDHESQAFIESGFGKLKERLVWRS
jgi:extracellular solute-binding protein (family 5)